MCPIPPLPIPEDYPPPQPPADFTHLCGLSPPSVESLIRPDSPDYVTNGSPIFVPPPTCSFPPPSISLPESRGRSRSRSPEFVCGNGYFPMLGDDFRPARSYSPDSRSPSPRRRSYRRASYRRSPSPMPYYVPPVIITPPGPGPPPPIPVCSMTPPPPSNPEHTDVLTFQHNRNMAYAPATKTYDEAIDNVLEIWPELREVDRERIHLFVVGRSIQLVRVPKVAWQLVLGDFPRYEVVHVKVDQPSPPPQYQGDEKVIREEKEEKEKEKRPAQSRGLFSSIKRIFWRR